MNFLQLAKISELKVLKRSGSTFCYNPPRRIIVGLTRSCNLNCVWCQRKDLPEDKRNTSLDFVQGSKIIESMPSRSDIMFCSLGEPLLYPLSKLCSMIKTGCNHKRNIGVTTNGTLLSNKVSERLYNSGLDVVHVSVDSPYSEIYQKIRGFSLGKVKDNIKSCVVPVIINTVLSEETLDSFEDMIKLVVETGAKGVHVQNLVEWHGSYHRVKDTENNRIFVKRMKKRCDENNVWTDIDRTLLRHWNGGCYQLFTELYITPEGFISPCCRWELGRIVKCYDVKKCWNCKEVRRFRGLLLKRMYPKFCREKCINLRGV